MELESFVPEGFFKARGTGGDGETVFDEIDLGNEPDWAGYDEDVNADCCVGVYEFKSKIERAKGK